MSRPILALATATLLATLGACDTDTQVGNDATALNAADPTLDVPLAGNVSTDNLVEAPVAAPTPVEAKPAPAAKEPAAKPVPGKPRPEAKPAPKPEPDPHAGHDMNNMSH